MTTFPPVASSAPAPTPSALAAAARDLMARTVDLPASRRELLAVLSEYRAAVHALAAAADRM